MATNQIHPRWIARMYSSSSGRDHLGLGSVSSNQILQYLSAGINVLTYHPRYYSFYSFLLYEFWQSGRPQTKQEWIRFFRPRAYIYSLAANLCEQDTHGEMEKIVGSQKTYSKSKEAVEAYPTDFNYIKSRQGGYGLYYRTVMAEIGLLLPETILEGYKVDLPNKPAGEEVAIAFRRSIQHTRYYREYFQHDNIEIPKEVISEYAQVACLCRLQVDSSAKDRKPLLKQFLYGAINPEAQSKDIDNRRASMRMFLDIANQTQGFSIGEDDFRQLIYYGRTQGGAKYSPSLGVQPTHKLWRLYQLREYYSFIFNAMWYYFCDWGVDNNGENRPLSMDDFIQHLQAPLSFKTIAEKLNMTPPDLTMGASFLAFLDWLSNSVGASGTDFDDKCGINSVTNEHKLYHLVMDEVGNRKSPDVMISGMLMMLGIIILRFWHTEPRSQDSWKTICNMGDDGRLSVEQFMRQLDKRIEEYNPTIHDVVIWLFNDYIILQHLIIASTKAPEDTYRFRREGSRLRFFKYDNPLTFRDSRFESVSTSIHELGLCGDLRNREHPLSRDGHELLKTGELSWNA